MCSINSKTRPNRFPEGKYPFRAKGVTYYTDDYPPLQTTLRPPSLELALRLPEALSGRTSRTFPQGIRFLAVRATISASRRANKLFVIFYIFYEARGFLIPGPRASRLAEAERRRPCILVIYVVLCAPAPRKEINS